MMYGFKRLPYRIADKIRGKTWRLDDAGMSGSTILLFDKMALKIEKISRSSENEVKLLAWLDGKLPVPEIIDAETRDGHSFLLMSRVPGEMACTGGLRNMEYTVRALAAGLKMLQSVDTSSCPCSNTVSEKLAQAKYSIENGLVRTDDFSPETFTSEGFNDVSELYGYLDRNRPKEDFVFSHGDFCLPNVFVNGSKLTGLLDWGNGGIADRWQDIALCVRSLRHNHIGLAGYGEREYMKYKTLLFSLLGIAPDEDKIRYYILLDELF